jgi:hypothetical protein
MRRKIFKSFKNGETRTIFVAKGIIDDHVGMPRAKVLIQFSSNRESPVKEVERLSHILQANKVSDSYFYTLVLKRTICVFLHLWNVWMEFFNFLLYFRHG